MQEAIVKVLKHLIDSLYGDNFTAEEVINDFLKNSEIALRENYQQELVNYLKKYIP